MAWKVLSGVQTSGRPTDAAYPGGAYRVRFDWGQYSDTTISTWFTDLMDDGRYVIPYIEMGYVATPAAWITAMEGWRDRFVAAKAASTNPENLEYIEFGNEINRGAPWTGVDPLDAKNQNRPYRTYQELWDGYIERSRISAPIFREAGIGFMCTCIGPSQYTPEWFRYLKSHGAMKHYDAYAVHCYSGGTHQGGGAATGLPVDTIKRLTDARTAMDTAPVSNPTAEFHITEFGWPGVPAVSTGTVTSGSNVITGVADTTDFVTGTPVRAATTTAKSTLLFPTSATLSSKTASTLTLSANATISAATAKVIGGAKPTDPGHQTYSTEAQQATRLGDVYTNAGRLYAVAEANRVRTAIWFIATDYSPASAPTTPGTYMEGNWAQHHGLRYESGTQACTDHGGGTCHKAAWDRWDATGAYSAETAVGIGRNTSGLKPTPVTGVASSITTTTATVAATVDPEGTLTDWRIQYGPDENYGFLTAIQNAGAGSSPVAVTANLTALPVGQPVHYRVLAWNEKGNAWGDRETFTTSSGAGAPILQAPVSPPSRSAGAGASPVNAFEVVGDDEPDLLPETQYFVRLVATNSAGSDTGAQQTFTTPALPSGAVVTTGAATSIGVAKATLNGVIDPNGETLDWQFEWGPTNAFGTSSSPVTVSGNSPISVSVDVTGLEPETPYYYELTTSTGLGGGQRTFNTLAPSAPGPEEPGGPSLAVSVQISTFDGRLYRLDPDDADPRNRPYELQFSTAAGDGFADASFVMYRPVGLDWPDLALFSRVSFIGADGSTAYEGRVAGIPRSVDDSGEQIQVQCQGLMASSRDRPFMEVYCDRSGGRWQQAGLGLRTAYAAAAIPLDSDYVPQVDSGSLSFKGSTRKEIQVDSQGVLVWKGPSGVKGSSIQYRGDDKGPNVGTRLDPPRIYARDVAGVVLAASPPDWDFKALTLNNTIPPLSAVLNTPRDVLAMRVRCASAHTPAANEANHRIIYQIAVYGNHGVALRDNGSEPDGVFASDVMKDVIARYCPLLDGSQVSPTETVLDHLVFDTPTAPFDAFTLLNGFHLYLLAAWEKGRVQFEPADLTKADWLVRNTDPGVSVDLHGDTVDEVANGIVVSYTDIDERQVVLMPRDTNGAVLYTELVDLDPDNPVNREGGDKWVTLELSNPATRKMALVLGQVALAENNRPKSPGTVTIAGGYVRNALQNLEPSYKVRYGQTLSILDLPNESPRLITATSWNEDGSLSITLEQPPTRIDAVLARLDLSQRSG